MKRSSVCGRLIMLAVIFVTAGCARVTVHRVKGESDYKQGLRFYRPRPYLLVTQDNQGKVLTSLIYLPNLAEEYVARVRSGWGATDAKIKLDQGWNLTEFGEIRDSKTGELIAAVGGILAGVASGGKGIAREGEERPALKPGLYAIEFEQGLAVRLREIPVSLTAAPARNQ